MLVRYIHLYLKIKRDSHVPVIIQNDAKLALEYISSPEKKAYREDQVDWLFTFKGRVIVLSLDPIKLSHFL